MVTKTISSKREEGFTLIELLITVVILAVIMGIAIPVYVNNKNSADSSKAKTEVANVLAAISAGRGTGTFSGTNISTGDTTGHLPVVGKINSQTLSASVGDTSTYATVAGAFCVSESGGGDTWVATSATYLVQQGTACSPLS